MPRLVICSPQQQVVFDREVVTHLVIRDLQQWLGVLSSAASIDGVLAACAALVGAGYLGRRNLARTKVQLVRYAHATWRQACKATTPNTVSERKRKAP